MDCEMAISKVVVPSGRPPIFTVVISDITERKRAEELARSNSELEALRQQEKEEAEKALTHYRSLLDREEAPVTAQMAGVGPLRQRAPEVLAQFVEEYGELLDAYLESLTFKQPAPHREIESLTSRLGDQGAGPRDVVDLHLRAVEAKSHGVHPKRANAYAIEGRLLALETMGYLVDYYHQGRIVRSQLREEKT